MWSFIKHIIQLVISPAKGWEDVSHAGLQPAELTRRGLYPMLAVLAVASMINLAYYDHFTLIEGLQTAIAKFTSYFVTLFIAQYLFSIFMPGIAGNAGSTFKDNSFVIYSLSTLIFLTIITFLIPGNLAILKIIPALTIFVMFKGARYLDVKEEKMGHFMFLSVFSIGVPPYLLSFLFNILMPDA